jgi:2-oxoglutarate ferredoxin oxidoreductase subunit delta
VVNKDRKAKAVKKKSGGRCRKPTKTLANKLWVDERYCKGCLICVEVCPTKAIEPARGINSKGYVVPIERDMRLCKACGMCELMCPDFAIAIEEAGE